MIHDQASLFSATSLKSRYRDLPSGFYSEISPETVGEDPVLVHANRPGMSLIGLTERAPDHADFIPVFAGHKPVGDAKPFAAVYAGHQFGHFVPQLGDGRALTIAEGSSQDGLWELQLKGAGRTPYSRFGDGRAVMRSVIREYLCSEHMAALGIPTTRALSIIATREGVQRETVEPGAVMSRVAPSHIRFGHFEYFHHRGETEHVKTLAEHVIEHHYPHLSDQADPFAAFFSEVVERTARLIAQWQAAGFAHGVMNTDNMSILGLTIDYGPFGFLDRFNPGFICNHSDHGGRYAFGYQPGIAFWNLRALASALTSLVSMDDLTHGLEKYGPAFDAEWMVRMRGKLGLEREEEKDEDLIDQALRLLTEHGLDYPAFWRSLADTVETKDFSPTIFQSTEESGWLQNWQNRLVREEVSPEELRDRLKAKNPKYVLRNWVAETAIRAVEDEMDLQTLDAILQLVTAPYADHLEHEKYAAPPPENMCGLSVSCSS